MSIKHFSNQFCPVCSKDTTHFVNKCRTCANVNETQYEARMRVNKHRQASLLQRYGRWRAVEINNGNTAHMMRQKRDWKLATGSQYPIDVKTPKQVEAIRKNRRHIEARREQLREVWEEAS